ncbi:hypothetical protein [Lacticaseibacillus mingshuiensis]|uniref:DUF998 domain-containing protein n=2 Tax=Bacilli TaxID=91061 RepID=A0ABW4CI48_9LACO|nr:hypothetical protein [Lacticaseibacillus mingshuiensis]
MAQSGSHKKIMVEVPDAVASQLAIHPGDELQLKVRGNTLSYTSGVVSPLRQRYLIIWPLAVALVMGIVAMVYASVQHLGLMPLAGDNSVASLTIILGLISGSLLFIGFFIKSRNDNANRFSSKIYWRNFPTITLSLVLILGLALIGIFWVLGELFPTAAFDRFTSMLILVIFDFFVNAFMVAAAFRINGRILTTLLTTVIIGGVVISMASNGQRHWWQRNLSFLGSPEAANSWQFNFTLILSALIMVALIDYLFVSLQEVMARTWQLSLLRVMLTLTAVDLGAVGAFPNFTDTPWLHWLHDSVSGMLVFLIVFLIIGLRWLLPGVTKEFLWLSYGAGIFLLILNFGFRLFGYPSLTAFEVQAFAVAFGWLLMLFGRLQTLVEEGPTPQVVKAEARTRHHN